MLPSSGSTSFCHDAPSVIELECHYSDAVHRGAVQRGLSSNRALIDCECDRLCSKTGQKVKVYWTEDKQWYHGVIRDFKASTNESLIVYDDGESEWLNLSSTGNETVEFLVDPTCRFAPHSVASSNAMHYKKGQRTSGKVAAAFDHGFVANLSSGYTAIAFDNQYIDKLIGMGLLTPTVFGTNTNLHFDIDDHDDEEEEEEEQRHHHRNGDINGTADRRSAAPSVDILKLLHFCRFDECIANQIKRDKVEEPSNGHRHEGADRSGGRKLRPRRSSHSRNNGVRPHSDTVGRRTDESRRTPSWQRLGITAATDPITRKDRESHIKLIHSDGGKRTVRSGDRPKKQRNGSNVEHSGMSVVDGNTNTVTKKCNTKSMLDLKAIYPLQQIRKQNDELQRTVIVIGAGISGLSCSRELMRCGYKVTVIEVERMTPNLVPRRRVPGSYPCTT